MSYPCEIKEQPAQPTLSIRTRAAVQALPQLLGQSYGAIMQYLGQLGEQPAGMPFAAYFNMDMQDLDVEIGFPVAKRLPDQGSIKAGEIPGGHVATCLYIGPYEACGPAYEALGQYAREHNFTPTGVAYEFYLNDPSAEPKQEPQTLILYPLKAELQPA